MQLDNENDLLPEEVKRRLQELPAFASDPNLDKEFASLRPLGPYVSGETVIFLKAVRKRRCVCGVLGSRGAYRARSIVLLRRCVLRRVLAKGLEAWQGQAYLP